MKFINIAIASVAFFAGNANAVDTNHPDHESAALSDACKAFQKEETSPLAKCAKEAAAEDPAVGWEFMTALVLFETCVKDAADDVDKFMECWETFAEVFIQHGCSAEVKQLEEACGPPSFEFEDFALDLAEVLKDGAFWEEDEEDEEEEFLAKKKGKRPSKKKTRQCQEKYIGVQECIDSVALQNTAATKRWEKIIFNRNRIARECANNAIYDEEKLECYANVLDRIARRCPAAVDDFKEACKIPFEDEDFALDLAEELEDGAFFWEGKDDEEEEFIASKPSKKCDKEGKKVLKCIEDTCAEETNATKKWSKSLEKETKKAEKCAKKVEDEDAKIACASNLLGRISEHCSVKALKKACKIEDFALDLIEVLEPTAAYATYLRG